MKFNFQLRRSWSYNCPNQWFVSNKRCRFFLSGHRLLQQPNIMIKQLSSHPFQVVNKCLVLTFHIVAQLVQDYFWICGWNILVRYCISWSMPGTCHCAWWGAYDTPSRAILNFQMGRKMGTMACTPHTPLHNGFCGFT